MRKRLIATIIAALLVFQIGFVQGMSVFAAGGETPYVVEIYQLSVSNEYKLFSKNTYYAPAGETVTCVPEVFEGFYFNKNLSTTTGTVGADGETVFRMYYDREEYTVYFSVAGEPYDEYLLYYGAPIEMPVNPIPPLGFKFIGWYTSIPATMPAHDLKIEGGFVAQSYRISFMVDEEIYTSYELSYDTAITLPAVNPTKAGYTFAGWDSVPAKMPSNAIKIKSLWTVNQYSLTFYLNGEKYNTIKQDFGTAVTAPTVTTQPNYVFSGWSPEVPATMPSENKDFNATYGVSQFDITLPKGSGFTALPVEEGSTKASYGGNYTFTVSLDDAFNKSNIVVKANGKVLARQGNIYTVENITENVEITVSEIKINTYTIIYKIEGYSDIKFTASHGSTLQSIPAIPEKPGYNLEFAHWDVDLKNKAVTQDYVVNAVYVKTEFIDFYVSGVGSVNYGDMEIRQYQRLEFPVGKMVTVTAKDINDKFLYWVNIATNKIVSYDKSFTFTVATSMDYRALFAPIEPDGFTITYVNNAKGIIFSEFVVTADGYVPPEPPVLSGFTFVRWDKTYEAVMSTAVDNVVSPVYQALPNTNFVTITNSNSVAGAGGYETYSNATVTAYGDKFSYWIDGTGQIVSYYAKYSFVINYDVQLTAVYGQPVSGRRATTRITSFNKNYDNKKLTFYGERSVFTDLTVVQNGIILTKNTLVGADADTFIIGGKDVIKGTGTNNARNGTYSLTKGNWDYINDTWYARSYVIVADNSGAQTIHYSDIVSVPAGPRS